ncbi:hypothetical protein Tcan_00746, partial [Toxocara canis]
MRTFAHRSKRIVYTACGVVLPFVQNFKYFYDFATSVSSSQIRIIVTQGASVIIFFAANKCHLACHWLKKTHRFTCNFVCYMRLMVFDRCSKIMSTFYKTSSE